MRKGSPVAFLVIPLIAGLAGAAVGVAADDKKQAQASLRRGFLLAGHCYTTTPELQEDYKSHVLYARLQDGLEKRSTWFPGTLEPPDQFRMLYGRLWAIKRGRFLGVDKNYLLAFKLTDFMRGQLTTGDEAEEGYADDMVQEGGTLKQISYLESKIGIKKHYDYLPLSAKSARLFLIVDHPYSAFVDKVPPLGTMLDDFVFSTKKPFTPKWMFTSAKFESTWVDKPTFSRGKMWKGGWGKGKWSDEEAFEVAFTEPFHVYGLGEDYYFVTDSGKAYHSPPLKAGDKGPRKVAPLWTDAKQPITHLVTHVDGEVPHLTYAFGNLHEPARHGGRDRFVLKLQGPEARAMVFSSAHLQRAQLKDPLKTLLEYARLIRQAPVLDPLVPK